MGVFKDGAYYPLWNGGDDDGGGWSEADLSDHAQDARDFEDRADLDRQERKEVLESYLDGPFPGEWAVGGGQIITIVSMTTSHLDNAIRYFERSELGEHPKIAELREERKRR